KKKVTVSCGIAQYPTHSKSIKKVIEQADQSLYFAKGNGKNVVITYDEILDKVSG
ncbi:MAG: diguanylate cyclase, partial [Clostridiales bacterium]|nr:diguanylate cyclase [Clostridiales bacterium]